MDSLRTAQETTVAETALRRMVLALTLTFCIVLGQATPWLLIVVGAVLIGVMAKRGTLIDGFRSNVTAQLFLAVFLGLTVCYAITAKQPSDMLWAGHFATLLLYVPFYDLLSRGARRGNAVVVADLAFTGSVISLIWAVVCTYGFGWPRAQSPLLNPILFGNTALLLGFLSLMGVLGRGERTPAYLLGPLLAVVAIALTGSRGPLIGVLPLTIAAAWFIGRELKLRWIVVIGVAAAFLALTALLVFALQSRSATIVSVVHDVMQEVVIPRLPSFPSMPMFAAPEAPLVVLPDQSANIRLTLWQAGLQAFLHQPLFGYGWGHLMTSVATFVPSTVPEALALPHLHNDIVNFSVAAGIVGVLLYLVLMLAPAFSLPLSLHDQNLSVSLYGLAVVLLTYASAGLTDLMFGYQFHTMLFVLLSAIVVGYCRRSPAGPPP